MSVGKNKNKKPNQKAKKSTGIVVAIACALSIIAIIGFITYRISNRPHRMYPSGGCAKTGSCVDKPILYLYPTEETNVNVSFSKPTQLTTTYPKYYGGWSVKVMPNGNIYDLSGQEYYALYWEEQSNYKPDQSTAFYVTSDNAIEFLEEKLEYIGLNDRERNEFIMYWLPILESNEQSIVRFAFTEELQTDNKLNISPAPDSLLRVRIFVEKVEENPNLPEPTLQHFERKGFAAIEWGGTKQ